MPNLCNPATDMVLESPDYQVALTAIAALLTLLKYALASIQGKAMGKQRFFIFAEPALPPSRRAWVGLMRLTCVMVIIACAWKLGGAWFDFWVGGYTVFLLVDLMYNVHSIFYFRGLRDPGAASGKIELSRVTGYKNAGTRLLAAGALMLCLFGLFGLPHFLGASLLALGTGIGSLLRAKRAAG